jgi:hypothetical protein
MSRSKDPGLTRSRVSARTHDGYRLHPDRSRVCLTAAHGSFCLNGFKELL